MGPTARPVNKLGHCGKQKGRPESRPFSNDVAEGALALRELEAAAGLLPAVLLTLDDARIAGQEAFLLERAAKLRLIVGQRLGEAVTDRAGLAGETAAVNVDGD